MYGELARINVAATLERKKKKRILMFKNRDGLVNEKIKERGEKNDLSNKNGRKKELAYVDVWKIERKKNGLQRGTITGM